jgi:Holliday junction resolvasome RuvABC endonuclease subunit
MNILALDLSLTATGAVMLWEVPVEYRTRRPFTIADHTTIKPPWRKKDERTSEWNRRRYTHFVQAILKLINNAPIDAVVTEVTEHAYQVVRGAKSTKGIEYRAGYGLGRASGWLDAVLTLYVEKVEYHQIDAGLVKLRVSGARAASKAAVKDGLRTYFGYEFDDSWDEAQIDALAVGVAWHREREQRASEERMRRDQAALGRLEDASGLFRAPVQRSPRRVQRSLPGL